MIFLNAMFQKACILCKSVIRGWSNQWDKIMEFYKDQIGEMEILDDKLMYTQGLGMSHTNKYVQNGSRSTGILKEVQMVTRVKETNI